MEGKGDAHQEVKEGRMRRRIPNPR